MLSEPYQKPDFNSPNNKDVRQTLRQKLLNLFPPMWRGNHADMPLLTYNRIWFLHETRFLFFTRNGPVEITLKPSVVIAVALIGMVGVSVIFLSTIFASYSAIEVMRDEAVQTAEASSSLESAEASSSTIFENVINTSQWQNDSTPHPISSDNNTTIAGKTAAQSNPIISKFNTRPQVATPFPAELESNRKRKLLPDLAI